MKFSQLVKRSPCLLVGGNCSIFSEVNILEARGEPTMENNLVIISCSLADPDLQIRVGGSHLDPEIRGGGGRRLKKNFFRPFGPQFGLKIRGGGGSWASPLDPPLMPLCLSPIPYVSFGTQIAKETKTQATVIAIVYFLINRQQRTIRYRLS